MSYAKSKESFLPLGMKVSQVMSRNADYDSKNDFPDVDNRYFNESQPLSRNSIVKEERSPIT